MTFSKGGSSGGGWITAINIDFSLYDNQTFSADANYTIGRYVFAKLGTANESSAAALVKGTGITFAPAQSSDYFTPTITVPRMRIAVTNLGIQNLDWSTRFRVFAHLSAESITPSSQYQNSCVGIDANSVNFGLMMFRGVTTGGAGFIMRDLNGAVSSLERAVALDATNRVYGFEVDSLLPARMTGFHGAFGTNWPSFTAMSPTLHKLVTNRSSAVPALSSIGISIGAMRAGAVAAYTATFRRLIVQYRNG